MRGRSIWLRPRSLPLQSPRERPPSLLSPPASLTTRTQVSMRTYDETVLMLTSSCLTMSLTQRNKLVLFCPACIIHEFFPPRTDTQTHSCLLSLHPELKQAVLSRQREFKIAAINAKQSGNIAQAKQHYIVAKVRQLSFLSLFSFPRLFS